MRYRITLENADGVYVYRDYDETFFLNWDSEYIGSNVVDMFDTIYRNTAGPTPFDPPKENEPPL